MTTIHASAPLRIDLAGGTLDIWPIHLALPQPGVTVNAAIDLPAEAWVEVRPGWSRISLESVDQGARHEFEDVAALAHALRSEHPPLPLLAHALLASGLRGGVRVKTHARSPKGAGLGGSSALLVALLAALGLAEDQKHRAKTLIQLAQDTETRLLGKPTGYQDFYPPFYGGCLALEGAPGGVRPEPIQDVLLSELDGRLRLIYTGEPHHSGMTNWGVVKAFLEGRPHAVKSLLAIADNARAVRAALREGDLDTALEGAVEDGRLRKRMAPRISTPTIKAVDQLAKRGGALGTKILGAGGGGCVLVILGPDTDPERLDARLADGPGEVLPLSLTAQGLRLERSAGGIS